MGASIGYFLTALPTTLLSLALSRIPAGIFKHSQSVSKTYLADVSQSVDRPKVFGNFNAVSSLGFVIGPLIGGHLAMQSNGFSKVASLTGVIFMINFFFVWFCVKPVEELEGKTNTCESRTEVVHDNRANAEITQSKLIGFLTEEKCDQAELENRATTEATNSAETTGCHKIASFSSVMDMLVIRCVMGFSMLVFRSNFMSMLEFHFHTTPKTNGYIMSFNGLVAGLSGLLIGPLAVYYHHNDSKMLLHFSYILTASILGITYSPNIYCVAACIFPLAVSSAVSRVCVTNLTFHRSRDDEKGVVFGIGNSLLSFARMISPALGGVLQEFSVYAPGTTGAMIAAFGLLTMTLFPPDRNLTNKNGKKND